MILVILLPNIMLEYTITKTRMKPAQKRNSKIKRKRNLIWSHLHLKQCSCYQNHKINFIGLLYYLTIVKIIKKVDYSSTFSYSNHHGRFEKINMHYTY